MLLWPLAGHFHLSHVDAKVDCFIYTQGGVCSRSAQAKMIQASEEPGTDSSPLLENLGQLCGSKWSCTLLSQAILVICQTNLCALEEKEARTQASFSPGIAWSNALHFQRTVCIYSTWGSVPKSAGNRQASVPQPSAAAATGLWIIAKSIMSPRLTFPSPSFSF